MGIKTSDMIHNLPPKEITEGVDWLGILDSFNPKLLDDRFLNECARRNQYNTCYRWDTPSLPMEERIEHSEFYMKYSLDELAACVKRIQSEGLTKTTYKNARAALITAIGAKGAHEYNLREYDRLGEEGRINMAREYHSWKEAWDKARAAEEYEAFRRYGYSSGDDYSDEDEDGSYWAGISYTVSMHEKVIRIRKGFLGSNGRPLTQRDFAKFIGYPINKYVEAEKVDRYGRDREPESEVEDELLDKLVMICHANPYWLFDDTVDADYAEKADSEIVLMGDAPCIYSPPDVILRWIEEGKPRVTYWEDGVVID